MKMARMYYIIAFVLGMSCFIVQFVLIREFLNIFTGNELVIGIMLSLWMLTTALGAWLGRFFRGRRAAGRTIFTLILLTGIFPLAGDFLAVWLKSTLFAPGVMLSLPASMLISLAGLGSFCLASGMLFTMLAGHFPGKEGKRYIAPIYATEALGSLAGGILFYTLLIRIADPMEVLAWVMIANLIMAAVFALLHVSHASGIITAMGAIVLGISAIWCEPGEYLLKSVHPGEDIIHYSNNPHGRLVITKQGEQFNAYQGGSLLFNTGDPVSREEKVHYAMALHPRPEKVLMVDGGLDGSFREALKYGFPEMEFTYRCTEPWARAAASKFTGLHWPYGVDIYTPRINRDYLASSGYDVILQNHPPPTTMGAGVFYSVKYFKSSRHSLNEGGILSIRLPGAGNYLDQESRMMFSSVYQSLQNTFKYVRIIPGEHIFYLASDHPLEGNITELIEEKGIPTEYVNAYYVSDRLMDLRAGQFMDELDPDAPKNEAFRPIAAYLSLVHWLGMFNTRPWMVAGSALLFMLLVMLRLKALNFGLFCAGFSSAAAEFLLIIAFQVVYGTIYYSAGILIMVYMAGLFLGSGVLAKFLKASRKKFLFLQIALGGGMLLIPLGLAIAESWLFIWIWPLMLLIAVLSGMLYSIATQLQKLSIKNIASGTYSADLAGSAFGAFLVAVFLLPLAGMTITILLLALFNMIAAGRLRMIA